MKPITLRALRIPFRTSFKHAAAARHVTQSIWVEALTVNGNTGYGEGCPREYVTGESIDSVLGFFATVHHEIRSIEILAQLKAWVAANGTVKLSVDAVTDAARTKAFAASSGPSDTRGPWRFQWDSPTLGAMALPLSNQPLARTV